MENSPPVDAEMLGSRPTASSSKSDTFDKLPPAKTEPPNPYLQYVMVRRIALVNIDPKGVLNMKSVNEDWKKLSDEERNEYRVLTQTDKFILGSLYRKRVRKNVEEKIKK